MPTLASSRDLKRPKNFIATFLLQPTLRSYGLSSTNLNATGVIRNHCRLLDAPASRPGQVPSAINRRDTLSTKSAMA